VGIDAMKRVPQVCNPLSCWDGYLLHSSEAQCLQQLRDSQRNLPHPEDMMFSTKPGGTEFEDSGAHSIEASGHACVNCPLLSLNMVNSEGHCRGDSWGRGRWGRRKVQSWVGAGLSQEFEGL